MRALEEDPDRAEVVRLVQRREGQEPFELRHDRGVEAHGRGVLGAAVNDAVTDGREAVIAAVRRLQPATTCASAPSCPSTAPTGQD